MKKQMFNNIVSKLASINAYSSCKITWKSDFSAYTFGFQDNRDLSDVRKYIKDFNSGNSHRDPSKETFLFPIVNRYVTITYDDKTDKIRVVRFEQGYGYAYRKNKFYPIRTAETLLVYSKHLYYMKRIGKKKSPRILRGDNINFFGLPADIARILITNFLGTQYDPSNFLPISYRHFLNTESEHEALESYFGLYIPKVIKKFYSPEFLYNLYVSMKNPDEINKLCQFIAKQPNLEGTSTHDRGVLIANMLFGESNTYPWLVHDTVRLAAELKKKEISFKMTSPKRWEILHNRLSRERILKGVAAIKTDDVYKDALEGFPYEYELVDSKDRLIEESAKMQHCVATYANKINSGNCAIFSILYMGTRYTAEIVNISRDKKAFYLAQLKGFRNCEPPVELINAFGKLPYFVYNKNVVSNQVLDINF